MSMTCHAIALLSSIIVATIVGVRSQSGGAAKYVLDGQRNRSAGFSLCSHPVIANSRSRAVFFPGRQYKL